MLYSLDNKTIKIILCTCTIVGSRRTSWLWGEWLAGLIGGHSGSSTSQLSHPLPQTGCRPFQGKPHLGLLLRGLPHPA